MLWIGLTGGIATGKSTVSEMIRKTGFPVISADEIAHKIVAPGFPALEEIRKVFGDSVLNRDKSLNRKQLGQIVFADKSKLKQLESILHPRIQAEVLSQKSHFKNKGVEMAFYDVPLLFENKLERDFDKIIMVTSSEEQQRARMALRDGLSSSEIKSRLNAQLPLSEKIKRADIVIENVGTLDELSTQVNAVIASLKKR